MSDHYHHHHSGGSAPSIQDQLHDLSTFTFPKPIDPEEDPTGRAAFRAICEKIDRTTRQTFLRFPSASVVEKLEAVDTISFAHCGLGDKGVIALGEALKLNQAVTELDLSDNGITHKGLSSLLNVLPKTVKVLDLSNNRLTRGSIVCPSMELMCVKENMLLQKQLALEARKAAEAAEKKANKKSSASNAASMIANPNSTSQQQQQTTMTSANSNNTDAQSPHQTVAALSASTLGIVPNALGSTVSAPSGSAGHAIGQLLSKNTTLQTLSLKGNKLNDTDTVALAEGLAENASLGSLDLSHNEIGSGSASALAIILLRSELREINLEWNKLQNAGAALLIKDGLPVTTVKRIFLGWNGLGDESAEQLGKVMVGSSTLEELDISNNHIGPKGAEQLAKGVKVSMALAILVIHDNPLQDDGCCALLRAIAENQTLTNVDMRATGAGKMSAEMLPSLLMSKPASFQIDMPRTATGSIDDF